MIKRAAQILLFSLALMGGLTIAHASSADGVSEDEVRTAFLLNFIRFTEFPAGQSSIRVCVFEASAEDSGLSQLHGKAAGAAVVEVHKFDGEISGSQCDVAYFPGTSETGNALALQMLPRWAGNPVLTVGEGPAFVMGGGVMNFFWEDGKLRFEVSADHLEKSGLRLSSKLLRLARLVD